MDTYEGFINKLLLLVGYNDHGKCNVSQWVLQENYEFTFFIEVDI